MKFSTDNAVSPSQMRARSSRALAQRSSSRTAFCASNAGATRRGQSEPSSAETRSTSSVSSTVATAVSSFSPSCSSTRRAAEARTPLRPVMFSVNSPRAAASTVPPLPPPVAGNETLTPRADPTEATALSMTASTAAASASAPELRPPRSPPRMLAPSRVPRATAAVTWCAQPSPSSQTFLTRSAM